jgi:hypothetical protein
MPILIFMEIISPVLKRKENFPAVYKITFSDKWFYIGSSANVKRRFGRWRTCIKNDKHLPKNIRTILSQVSVVSFEVVKIVIDLKLLRDEETLCIQENWDNPLLLNRCPEGGNTKGRKPYIGYTKPVKKKYGNVPLSIPVAIFTKSGELIKKFRSKEHFSKEMNIEGNQLNKILSGERGQPKKFNVMLLDNKGYPVCPPAFIPKSVSGYIYPKSRKAVIQMDKNHNVIATHDSVWLAAKNVGCSRSTLSGTLNIKGKLRLTKGFFFKYAQ